MNKTKETGEECVWGCGGVCVWVSEGGGHKGYIFCCDICIMGVFYPLCMLIITNLNASDVALMFFLDVVFELMSLQELVQVPCE